MSARIYDNGGETFDRYTVIFADGSVLGIGDTGNAPNGFCQHVGSIYDHPGSRVEEGPHLGARITLDEMTDPARRAVLAEMALLEADVAERLEYLREDLADQIPPDDGELLEAADVPEFPEDEEVTA